MLAVAYNMQADLYPMTRQRDQSGQLLDVIDYGNPVTIVCNVRYASGAEADEELYGELQQDMSRLVLRAPERIEQGTDIRVGNVRHTDVYGRIEHAFVEDGLPGEYVVLGERSEQDSWSRTVGWRYMLETPAS